jgi:hypothetical protein
MTRRETARRIGRILGRLDPLPAVSLRHADPDTPLVAVVRSFFQEPHTDTPRREMFACQRWSS